MGPTYTQSQRREKRRKDTRPETAVAERRSDDTAKAEQEEPGEIGNIGWYFGNWGQLSKKEPHTARGNRALQIQHRIKQSPAQVLGLSECEFHTQAFLSTPVALDLADPAQLDVPPEKRRNGFEYLCLWGQEESTCLRGVRAHTAQRIELLEWHRIRHGKYQGGDCPQQDDARPDLVGRLGGETREHAQVPDLAPPPPPGEGHLADKVEGILGLARSRGQEHGSPDGRLQHVPVPGGP